MASSSLMIKLGAQVSGALTGLKSVYSGLDGITRKVTSLSFVKLGGIVGLVTAGAGIAGVGAKILALGANAESTRLAFRTMLGSVQQGDAMMEKLDRFSNSTPYSGDQVNRAAKTLLGFGIAAGNVEGTLRKIGDVAAGSGKDFNELSAIYGKVFAKGKADSEALNQMVEAGIPIVKILGEMYGKTGDEIYDMASKGKISAEDISKAFDKMSGSGGVYANMMEQQSKTVSGMWGAITGQLAYAGSLIGEAIEPLVKSVLSYFQGWADEIVKMCQDGRMVQYLATIAYTAIDMGATITKWLLVAKEYGVAAFGAIMDVGVAVWYGVQGSAVLAFVNVIKWVNTAWAQTKAVFAVIGRIAAITWNSFLAGVSNLCATVVNLVLQAVNSVVGMMNKIPGVNIDMVEKPAFVEKLEKTARDAAAKVAADMGAVASGQDFKDASAEADRKNAEWAGTEAQGNEMVNKSADAMLSAVARFSNAAKNIESGSKAIDGFAAKATGTVEKWQKDQLDKQNQRKNAKLTDGKDNNTAFEAAAKAPMLKADKKMTDSLTKIGGYNFGPNAIKSIDKERNALLTSILDTINKMDINGGALA